MNYKCKMRIYVKTDEIEYRKKFLFKKPYRKIQIIEKQMYFPFKPSDGTYDGIYFVEDDYDITKQEHVLESRWSVRKDRIKYYNTYDLIKEYFIEDHEWL